MNYRRAIIRNDEMGRLLAAAVSGGYCWYTWSDDGGTTWATGRQVTTDTVDDEQPGLAEMPDGSLRIAVTQSDAVRMYSSTNDGESWSSVAVLQ